jgi:hypothetical protein
MNTLPRNQIRHPLLASGDTKTDSETAVTSLNKEATAGGATSRRLVSGVRKVQGRQALLEYCNWATTSGGCENLRRLVCVTVMSASL